MMKSVASHSHRGVASHAVVIPRIIAIRSPARHVCAEQINDFGGQQLNVFIVYAHHEPTSFNAALLDESVTALRTAGHDVVVSDLYAMKFDPVSDRRNFVTTFDPQRLKQQAEEAHASAHDGFAPDLKAETAKLDRCDLLIFQFPIWWLGMPAILKGWVDRVLVVGHAYGGGRYFETGRFKGKRAMCTLTVGGLSKDYDGSGAYADVDTVLYPIHRGILAFTGFEVLPPFVVYGPNRITEDERKDHVARYGKSLTELK